MIEHHDIFGGMAIDFAEPQWCYQGPPFDFSPSLPIDWKYTPGTVGPQLPAKSHSCEHCGGWHSGECPRIKAIEYHKNGRIKRVEYRD